MFGQSNNGVPATEQLKDQYSQRPAVGRAVVTFVQDDLRSNVLRSSTKGPRLLTQPHFLSKAKVHLQEQTRSMLGFPLWNTGTSSRRVFVHQLGVASVVQYDVLRFEVSVDDPTGVQEGQGLDDAAGVEPSGAVVK